MSKLPHAPRSLKNPATLKLFPLNGSNNGYLVFSAFERIEFHPGLAYLGSQAPLALTEYDSIICPNTAQIVGYEKKYLSLFGPRPLGLYGLTERLGTVDIIAFTRLTKAPVLLYTRPLTEPK